MKLIDWLTLERAREIAMCGIARRTDHLAEDNALCESAAQMMVREAHAGRNWCLWHAIHIVLQTPRCGCAQCMGMEKS